MLKSVMMYLMILLPKRYIIDLSYCPQKVPDWLDCINCITLRAEILNRKLSCFVDKI